LGARLTGRLLREFGSPEAVFDASLTALDARQVPAAVAQAIHTRQMMSAAAKELSQAEAAKCKLVTWDEPLYPQMLREIYDPPPLLYVKGNSELLNRHAIGIVGTRRPTPYGNQMAGRLANDLAARGLVVVSGLARGIGATAHKGALTPPQGATVGILGSGVDVIYPKENRKIFAEI
jgi:DNA processing protein